MRSLHDLQVQFCNGIFNPEEFELEDGIQEHGLSAKSRLQIYRNNIFITLTTTLQSVYPTIQQLLGEEFFVSAAHQYIKQYPSISGDLYHFGAEFGEFLVNLPSAKNVTYLSELAVLEWSYHEVMYEANAAAFDWLALSAVPVARYENIKFRLHPASRLLNFHFPILRIWKICRESDSNENIDMTAGGDQVLVIRRHWVVDFENLTYPEFILLNAVKNGKSFARGCSEALAVEPGFNINSFLEDHLQRGTIVGFSLE